jgi:predicted nuclease with TOPRIM domain
MPTDAIECPLCLGEGKLKRTEVLDRLGVKDFARIAQLSAEEAFRLLLQKHKEDQQHVWLRFEAEIQRVRLGLEDKLRFEQSEKEHLNRRVEDYFREISQLRERNQQLETEMSKVARIGRREEMDFAEEARTWAGISVSEKLPKNGDFILAFRDPSGVSLEPRMLVDTKDKSLIQETDVAKLLRDAKERSISVAVLVARNEEQLRQVDRELRWGCKDGVWVLRTTRQWLPRDLEVLRPLLERMRTEGPDFLQKNSALAEEVRRTFVDIDAIEKELGKASKAIQSVSGLVAKYKIRLNSLCDSTAAAKKLPVRQRERSDIPQSVGGL